MQLAIVLLCLTYVSAQNSNITSNVVDRVSNAGNIITAGLGALPNLINARFINTHGDNSDSDSSSDVEDPYDTATIIAGYNYPVEQYSVTTDDGYILQIHRIPCKGSSKHQNSILIMSDFWTSSAYWVLSGPKYSLAFYLANLGYDVWLGNNRGGKYGQEHKFLNVNEPAFWYYSYHEWGVYDLPAIIDFIISKVGCKKISYIGWGYGATEFFVMASEKPEYMKKIKNMQGLGPIVYNQHTLSLIEVAALNVDEEV